MHSLHQIHHLLTTDLPPALVAASAPLSSLSSQAAYSSAPLPLRLPPVPLHLQGPPRCHSELCCMNRSYHTWSRPRGNLPQTPVGNPCTEPVSQWERLVHYTYSMSSPSTLMYNPCMCVSKIPKKGLLCSAVSNSVASNLLLVYLCVWYTELLT